VDAERHFSDRALYPEPSCASSDPRAVCVGSLSHTHSLTLSLPHAHTHSFRYPHPLRPLPPSVTTVTTVTPKRQVVVNAVDAKRQFSDLVVQTPDSIGNSDPGSA